MSTTPTLLACPFCGGPANFLDACEPRKPLYWAECKACGVPGADDVTVEGAAAKWNRRAALTQGAGEAVEPVAWPRDAAEVRQFMKGNCAALWWAVDEATPHQDDRYQLTAHDFLSAVNWWADFPHHQAAQQLQQAVARERESILDEWADRMQSDLEHGVRLLNERAAAEFTERYPQLAGFAEAIRAKGTHD